MNKYLLILFLLLSISSCSIFKDEPDPNKEIKRIQSIPEEIDSYRSRLNNLDEDQRKIKDKSITVKLPDDSEIEFVWIPPTTSDEWKEISGGRDYYIYGDNLETYSPYRFVKLTYGFLIAKTEITQSQWKLLMGTNPSENKRVDTDNIEDLPVNSVSWKDSNSFIKKFSKKHSLSFLDRLGKLIYFRDYEFRLPTEAEWEYAARAGMYEPTSDYLQKTSWHGDSSSSIKEVGSKSANPWGIHDILGNVFELTHDCWPTKDDIKFGDQKKVRIDPLGSAKYANSRGGAYYSRDHVESFGWRSSCNEKFYKGSHAGLRLVLAPPISKLNKAPALKPKPKSILISSEEREMKMISEAKCGDNLKIDRAYVTKEFNDHIIFNVCYEYTGETPKRLSALTYLNGDNTGKWGYQPGYIKPGKDCTPINLSKSSLHAYSSDAIKIETYDYSCEVMFEFEKYWTDGTDEKKKPDVSKKSSDTDRAEGEKELAEDTIIIQSVSEHVKDYKNRLNELTDSQRKLDEKSMKLKLPDNSNIEFIWIPPTTSERWKEISGGLDYYVFGDNVGTYSPYRLVKLTYGFFISKTEITQHQWELIMGNNPSENKKVTSESYNNLPVNSVSWKDAVDFTSKFPKNNSISAFVNTKNELDTDYEFRLPTEAEWEYAARASMFRPYHDYLDKTAWYGSSYGSIQDVATKQPNPWGIHDMLGNVFEITHDCWPTTDDIKFGDQGKVRINPLGPEKQVNARGGAYYSREPVESFAWKSRCNYEGNKRNHMGFRLVLAPPISKLIRAPALKPKPESILISSEQRELVKISEKKCDGNLKIDTVSLIKEFNDHVLLNICYQYTGDKNTDLSALTYYQGSNTGKWGYSEGIVRPGNGCTELRLSKSSLFAYSSDAIKISPYHSSCELMYEYQKFWTDGTDIKKEEKIPDNQLDTTIVDSSMRPSAKG